MNNIAIVYWSGTGNTETMAREIRSGINADVFLAKNFTKELVTKYDVLILGCPAMGTEQLEESEFEPMFHEISPYLKNKKIALFGSYDWGNGEWMRLWHEDCIRLGADIVTEPLTVKGTPEGDICRTFSLTVASSL